MDTDFEPSLSSALSNTRLSSASTALDSQPVDFACLKQWDRLLQRVEQPGCSYNACDELGRTALHYAAGYGIVDAVHSLIDAGASVSAGDRFGVTPLHWATLKGQADCADALMAAGADALVQATAGVFKGRSALDMAAPTVRDQLMGTLGQKLFEQRKVRHRPHCTSSLHLSLSSCCVCPLLILLASSLHCMG
jgi:ankyrin repeat protein